MLQLATFCIPQIEPFVDIFSIYNVFFRNFESRCKTKPKNKKDPVLMKRVVLLMLTGLRGKKGKRKQKGRSSFIENPNKLVVSQSKNPME